MAEIKRVPENGLMVREIAIHEYYTKDEDGQVFWNWKFEHEAEFTRVPVPYPEIPYTVWNPDKLND